MMKSKAGELRTPTLLMVAGLIALFIAPMVLIMPACFPGWDFSSSGQIGDTIGGITSPIVNSMGALLVYFAFRAQVKANTLLQRQIDEQKINRKEDNESETLFELYGYLVEAIDNFTFNGFEKHELVNMEHKARSTTNRSDCIGSKAIYNMMDEIRCHYHGSEEDLDQKQEVAELIGILRIMELLTERLEGSSNENRSILSTMLEHQFRYRIMTRLKDCPVEDLAKSYCSSCKHEHGLPDAMLRIIKTIDGNLVKLKAKAEPNA